MAPKTKVNGEKIFEELESIEIPTLVKKKLKAFTKITNQKIVLSLAGGAAKGIVGNLVLLYLLDKLNLMDEIEEIWSVSAGSLVGAAYCAGISFEELVKTIANIRLRDFVSISVKHTFDHNPGFFPTDRLHQFLENFLEHKTFEDLSNEIKQKFFILATRITGEYEELAIFKEGPLSDAVTASISIPDIFEPFKKDGKMYVDGGLVENTPCITVARHHLAQKDNRHLAILSTCFGQAHYSMKPASNLLSNLIEIVAIYRYKLQLVQNELTRSQPNTDMLMLNIDVPIPKTAFNKMGPQIVPAYHNLIDKLEYICATDNWNIDY